MSGFAGDLSDSQKERLDKFRDSIKDIRRPEHDDEVLLRFLRARRFDLKKTEKMFRTDLQWREENKISTIMDWYKVPEAFQTHWCGGVCGIDKTGHAVYITPVGNFDAKGVLYSAKGGDILKTYTYYLEGQLKKYRELADKKGIKPVEGSLMIFDLESLSVNHLWKPGIDMFNKTAMIAEQHYPEHIHKVFVVRAPKIFPVTYSLIKPFLREDTRKKVHVCGSNWKEELQKHIDADQLPVYWGGTMKDPDGNEKCPSLIKLGGKIPEKFFLKDREPPHTMATHKVSRGGVIEFKYDVKNQHSVFRYEFATDCADIKFGVDRLEGKGRTAIMKLEKYNSHMVPENGEIAIIDPGTYVARFDNTHSWTKAKKLSYWLEMLEPSDEEPEFREMDLDALKLDD